MRRLVSESPQFCLNPRNAPFDKGALAEEMLADMQDAIDAKSGGKYAYSVKNYHRSIGARISGEIARRWGNYGMSEAPLMVRSRVRGPELRRVECGRPALAPRGRGQRLRRQGHGGRKIVLKPPAASTFLARETVIMGNTCLYGATGGELYAAGTAGERFAVRNSGALAVIEGAGDHCCEYMTGGVVCVLGRTGVNFGAGFTGGFAYVLDIERDFVDRYNHD